MLVPYRYIALPFRQLSLVEPVVGWIKELESIGMSLKDVFEICLDFYLDFSFESGVGIVSEDPILFRYLVTNQNNFEFHDKFTERLINFNKTHLRQHYLQVIADLGYVMLRDIETRLNQHVTASRYPIFGLDIQVLECDTRSVIIGARYVPNNVRQRKFHIPDPTLLPH